MSVISTKTVHFYTAMYEHKDGSTEICPEDFWTDLHDHVATLSLPERQMTHNTAPYVGFQDTGVATPVRHFRVGRIRERADWPDTIDDAGAVTPLDLEKRNLFEGAYVVPFGARNRIALMSPLTGLVHVSAVEYWVNVVLGTVQDPDGIRVRLVPVLDTEVEAKLGASHGLTKLVVRFRFDGEYVPPPNSGAVDEAIGAAIHAAGTQSLDVELAFSSGTRRNALISGDELKRTAQNLLGNALGLKKVKATLLVEDADGLHSEAHDLLKDVITATAQFRVPQNEALSPDEALDGINKAIDEYRRR